jgi:hypothetical protein
MKKTLVILTLSAALAGCDADLHAASEELGSASQAVVDKGFIDVVPNGYEGLGCGESAPSGTGLDPVVRSVLRRCEEEYNRYFAVHDMVFTVAWSTSVDGNDFLRHPEAIEQYVADVQAAKDYSRTKMGARSYERNLTALVDRISYQSGRQNEELRRPDPRIEAPLENFEKAFKYKHVERIGPVVDELANKRKYTEQLRGILARYRAKLDPLDTAYADLVVRFQAFKATEATVIAELTDFSERASAASLQGLPQVQVDLVEHAQDASEASNALSVRASRLLGTMGWIEREYHGSLLPYEAFLEEHPDLVPTQLTDEAQRSISNMIAYIEERRIQLDAQASRLIRGISARSKALVLLAADEETQEARRDAAHLRAATKFLDEATSRDAEVSAQAERTIRYRYYLWTEKYDQYVSFLELEPLCTASQRPSWRDTGCIALNRSFNRTRTYMTSTIPRLIRATIPQLRRRGVAEVVLAGIEAELTLGRTREAIVRYDAAARLTEDM